MFHLAGNLFRKPGQRIAAPQCLKLERKNERRQHSEALTRNCEKRNPKPTQTPCRLCDYASVVNKGHRPSETEPPASSSSAMASPSLSRARLGKDIASSNKFMGEFCKSTFFQKARPQIVYHYFLPPFLSTKNNSCPQGGH